MYILILITKEDKKLKLDPVISSGKISEYRLGNNGRKKEYTLFPGSWMMGQLWRNEAIRLL